MAEKKKFTLSKFFIIVWILSIFVFTLSFLFATNFLRGQIQSTTFGNSNAFTIFFIGSILVGVVAFGLMILSFLYEKIKNKKLLTFTLAILFLGFCYSIYSAFVSQNKQVNQNLSSIFAPPKSTANAQEIIDLTNKERVNAGLKPLKQNIKLDEAAKIRAQKIIDFSEWNHEATKSGIPYTKAIKEVNYWNITYGENLAKGFYDSQSVIDSWMKSDGHKENLLNPKFQEIGIGILEGNLDNEQTQVIVQLFGGYEAPNYKQVDTDSWKSAADSLRSVLPSWEKIKEYSTTYAENKKDADRLIQIMNLRITRCESIYSTMKANKWLSTQQNQWIKEDTALYNEQNAISNRLNSLTWH